MGRPRVLVLHAGAVPSSRLRTAIATFGARARGGSALPPAIRDSRVGRVLFGTEYETLSYAVDWREAWAGSPRVEAELCDVNDVVAVARAAAGIGRHQLVVALHSAAGDYLDRVRTLLPALAARRGKLAVFFGNEFQGMPAKIAFARSSGADLICSQLPLEAARWLYAEAPGRVLAVPAALNPALYFPRGGARPVDIGFRGDHYDNALALGDRERTDILEAIEAEGAAGRLVVDIGFRRVPREAWAGLLNRWKGTTGAESGTYFLERDDATRRRAIAHLAANPGASWEEVRGLFFASREGFVSGKAISSRHFEALGTETCQVLVRGHYNGILEAGVHYLAVRPDLADLGEALERFRDPAVRAAIGGAGRELALGGHTYAHRVDSVLDAAGL